MKWKIQSADTRKVTPALIMPPSGDSVDRNLSVNVIVPGEIRLDHRAIGSDRLAIKWNDH